MNTYRYEFRTASGTCCCATDNPAYLCARCKAALKHGAKSDAEQLAERIQGYGTIVTETPDPYATPAVLRAAERKAALKELLADPTVHDLRGRPLSGYDFALAMRKADAEEVTR